jgi:integrase
VGARGDGVEAREKSIRLFFVWNEQRYRETLTVNGEPIKPTPANLKYAARVAAEIREKIRYDAFAIADYFPDSPRAGKPSAGVATFGEWCETWLATKGRLAGKTLTQYRNALEVWKSLLGADTPIKRLTHAVVAAKVGRYPWKSAKLLNNYLIPLRGVFALAAKDLKVENPMEGVENSKHQAPPPDPLSPVEMESILRDMRSHYDPRIWAYFVFSFMTGMRPEEVIALRWSDIDWRLGTARVTRARSGGEFKDLKTYNGRDVDLVDRAIEALKAMKPWTYLATLPDRENAQIFQNPVTNRPFHDERSQRDHYWTPCLRRLGIRHRRAYQTRHSYATNALSAGVNPAYIARQMGHKNAKMLFSVYAKWIDGADRGRERSKMEALLRNEKAA